MTIKAIETRYKGYRFRSRLEARWAVFFDALGIEWQYEPEGFELADGTRYLPDFVLNATSRSPLVIFEVKPNAPIQAGDVNKLNSVGIAICQGVTDGAFAVAMGDPMDAKLFIFADFAGEKKLGSGNAEWFGMFFCAVAGRPESSVKRAAEAARGARFEHGESGAR